MTVRKPGTWFLLTAAMIAIALGALHALEPGHGKTVVAAYLVGSRGTARHALMLAATVTASHTASVYVLGGLTLYASRWIVPERIYPWLGGVSGVIIAGLGVWLFGRRLIPILSPDHSHDHLHDHAHPHEHPRDHFHTHDHDHDRDHEHHRTRTTIIIPVTHDHPQFQPHRHDIFGRHIAGGETPAESERLYDARAACAGRDRRDRSMPRRAGGFAQRAVAQSRRLRIVSDRRFQCGSGGGFGFFRAWGSLRPSVRGAAVAAGERLGHPMAAVGFLGRNHDRGRCHHRAGAGQGRDYRRLAMIDFRTASGCAPAGAGKK